MSAVYVVAKGQAQTKASVAIPRGRVIHIAMTIIITASVDGTKVIAAELKTRTNGAKSANVGIQLLLPQRRKHAKRNVEM